MSVSSKVKGILLLVAVLFITSAHIAAASELQSLYVKIKQSTILVITDEMNEVINEIELAEGDILSLVSTEDESVTVRYNDRVGTVLLEHVEFLPTWENAGDSMYFEPVHDQTPVYNGKGSSKVAIGYLNNREDYVRLEDQGHWHAISFGGKTGYVLKASTVPASGVSKDTTKGNKIVEKVTVLEDAPVYYKQGEMVQYATVLKGQAVQVIKDYHQWYVIEVAGRMGYISKQQVLPMAADIVNPKQQYTYEQMTKDIALFEKMYPAIIKTKIIGKSVDGRDITAVRLGTGKQEVFINASHHAREHLTTNLVMEMLDSYAFAYTKNKTIDGFNIKKVLDKTSIWFVPMVNPDGVTLVQKGHTSAKNPTEVLKLNGGKTDFSAWKANIRGIDLNRQYPAGWATIRGNTGKPGPYNFKGYKPLSEPEVKALYDFTLQHNFKASMSYHSSGEIIFWHYKQGSLSQTKRDRAIAEKISAKTGYSLVKPQKNPSGGGYTDWFIQTYKKPAFTPEISPSVGPRPVPLKNFDKIWKQNHSVGLLLANQ
jgi:murein tripeptide amidase MpaA